MAATNGMGLTTDIEQEIFGFVCVVSQRGKVDALDGYVMIKEA